MRTRSSGSAAEEEGAGSGPGSGSGSSSDAGGDLSPDGRPSEATATSNLSLNLSSNLSSKTRHLAAHLPIPQGASQEVDRRRSIERRPAAARSRASNNSEGWKPAESRHGPLEKTRSEEPAVITVTSK